MNKAGKSIATGSKDHNDFELIENWRASHGYVINTFQIFFRRRIEKRIERVEFAQRLKRRKTVIDKITRTHPDGSPLMFDVTSMHDFAGCRLIFDDLAELYSFRNYVRSTESMKHVAHVLKHDEDKYDYIKSPRASGYRGIHDIYGHYPRAHRRGSKESVPWHGLLVEVQYRTRVQHAWATALEISDLVDGQRTKFDLKDSERVRFFALASELLARHHEGISNALQQRTTADICEEFSHLEDEFNILQRLSALREFDRFDKIKVHNVLNVVQNEHGQIELDLSTFNSPAEAIRKASELENSPESLNAVYVRADNPAQLRSAYRNYFNDPVDFVRLVNEVLLAEKFDAIEEGDSEQI